MPSTYYVLWTWQANYSEVITVKAFSPKEAKDMAVGFYGNQFQAEAKIYVFASPPVVFQPDNPEYRPPAPR